MPLYTFRDRRTGEEWDDLMSISEMEKFTFGNTFPERKRIESHGEPQQLTKYSVSKKDQD